MNSKDTCKEIANIIFPEVELKDTASLSINRHELENRLKVLVIQIKKEIFEAIMEDMGRI